MRFKGFLKDRGSPNQKQLIVEEKFQSPQLQREFGLRKIMVAAKGRLHSLKDGTAEDPKMSKRGERKNLKIYVEVEVKNPDTLNNRMKRQTSTLKSGGHMLNSNYLKTGFKNMDKGKRELDNKSMSSKVGRKVLADVGNRIYSFSKTEQGKISRPGKEVIKENVKTASEEQRMKVQSRNSITTTVAGRKFVRENVKAASDEPRMKVQSRNSLTTTVAGRKFVRENVKTASDEPRMKVQSRNSIMTTAAGSSTTIAGENVNSNSDEPRVKLQSSNSASTAITRRKSFKENVKIASDKSRMKVQGRSSITTTVAARKSIGNPLLTRKSLPVAALKQASRVQTSGTTKENPEKLRNFSGKHGFPVNPSTRRSTVPKPSSRPWGNRVSDGFVMTKSRAQAKVDAGVKSRKSVPVDIPKGRVDKVSVSKSIPSTTVSQDEPALEESTSSISIQRRKSDRRNSFISSLMSRSKLLKQRIKVTSPETLPDIYDDRNHLEVCDYVDDIYQYYWVMEAQNPLLKNYLEFQQDITPQMRGVLINWLIEVHQKFELMEETLFLTVRLLDRYLSLENIKKNEMQLVGLTALLLASKYEDFWHPQVGELIGISAEPYSKEQMLKMEKTILTKLKFRLNEPTIYVFMLRFLKAAQCDMKFERLAFYLIELCLVQYEALNYKPSMLCASAIYVARCTMQLTPRWTPLLAKHARYEESQISGCAEMILKFHKAAKTSLLKVTYEKYANADLSRVATIKPMDRLPS